MVCAQRNATQDMADIVQSQIPLQCAQMKEDGSCRKFYADCEGCDGSDLNPDVLVSLIEKYLITEK